jgi:hypothetical protein
MSDGRYRPYHKLDIWGDSCRFFDLELPSQRHGVASIRYYSATIPRFVRKLILRMARRLWARCGVDQENAILLNPDRVARWQRLYGLGKGNADVIMTDDTREFLEEKLSELGSNLGERLEDWDGFTFLLPGLFGGIVNHGRERPDWSIHT